MAQDALTKERLVDLLRPAMKDPIDQYAAQKSAAATKAEADRAELEKVKAQLGADSPAAAELDRAIKSLEHDPGTDRKARLREAAIAVVAVCNELGVPVEVKKPRSATGSGAASTASLSAEEGKKSGGKRKRTSPAEIERLSQLVRKSLPPASTSDARCKTIEDITNETGLSKDEVRSALSKLKREGDAESNGFRGPRGGWRKAAV